MAYYQWGAKTQPNRTDSSNKLGAPIHITADSTTLQDSPSWVYKGEWNGTIGQNLFVDDDGRWAEGAYVPAFVRRYPFCISRLSVDGVPKDLKVGVPKDEAESIKKKITEAGGTVEIK